LLLPLFAGDRNMHCKPSLVNGLVLAAQEEVFEDTKGVIRIR
jgi:hypothetical protein